MTLNVQINVKMPSKNSFVQCLKIATGVAVVLAIFYQDLIIVANDALQTDYMSYILVIPFLFTYLLYRKRKMLRAAITAEKENYTENTRHLGMLGGILLSATAVILYWYGSYTFTPLEYHVLTLPIFAAGLTLILFNPQTLRQAAFPTAFLVFLAPLPSQIIYNLGSTLSIVSSEASNGIVNLLGIHSTLSSISGTPAITITQANGTILPPFAVDIACSGIYSLIGLLVFAAFVAFVVSARESGSDRILGLMNRGYKIESVKEKLLDLKTIPDLKIDTHIIVGFPGETEEDFQESVELVKEIEFSELVIWKYDDRPHTKASNLPDKVAERIINKRARILAKEANASYTLSF